MGKVIDIASFLSSKDEVTHPRKPVKKAPESKKPKKAKMWSDSSSKKKEKGKEKENKDNAQKGKKAKEVIYFKEEKHHRVVQERRRARRTILSGFIGTYVVIPDRGLGKVEFHDISEKGLAFDGLIEYGQFKENEIIHLRVYLSKEHYFSFDIQIRHVRLNPENACYRYGALFSNHSKQKEILYHFVKFVEEVSQQMQSDRGDKVIFSSY